MNKEAFSLPCPACNSATAVKVFEDTVLVNFPLYCPHCQQETIINVVKLKVVAADTVDK